MPPSPVSRKSSFHIRVSFLPGLSTRSAVRDMIPKLLKSWNIHWWNSKVRNSKAFKTGRIVGVRQKNEVSQVQVQLFGKQKKNPDWVPAHFFKAVSQQDWGKIDCSQIDPRNADLSGESDPTELRKRMPLRKLNVPSCLA